MKILVVEDEKSIQKHVTSLFARNNFDVDVFDNVEDVVKTEAYRGKDIVLLDLKLKGEGGESLVQFFGSKGIQIPVLVLSSLTEVDRKVELFDNGIFDYITKPFNDGELLARVMAIYRRSMLASPPEVQKVGTLEFYWSENRIVRGKKTTILTNREKNLLFFLVQNEGKTIKNDDLLVKVWKTKLGYHSNILQSTVKRLRDKIDTGFKSPLIKNVHGIGYRFEYPEE